MNEPVAWIGETLMGRQYINGQKVELPVGTPLYTHQYERPHNTVLVPCDKLAEMQAEIEALKAHPVKEQDESFDRTASHMAGEYVSYKEELTDEEILDLFDEYYDKADMLGFARAILRKASE